MQRYRSPSILSLLLLVLTLLFPTACGVLKVGIEQTATAGDAATDRANLATKVAMPGIQFPTPARPRPMPTSAPDGSHLPHTTPGVGSSTIASTTTIATSTAPGWTRYISINRVRDLAFAPDGTLWASTYGNLVHWDLSSGTYTRHLIHAEDIAVAPDGTLWLATDYGVCHFDGATCKTYTEADGLIHNAVRAVAVASDGAVWMGTETGVSRFDGRSWKSYPSPVPVEELAVAANGEVWVATVAGVGRYTPSKNAWTTYTEELGLTGLSGKVIATGPAGDVWIYIPFEGVYRFDGQHWKVVEGIPGGMVADIALGTDGTPWVATTGGSHYPGGCLAYRDGDTWTDVTSERGLAPITAVALGPGGVVAAGTNLGLGIYQGGEWRLLKDGPTYDRVASVAVTPDGAAWFAFGDDSSATHYPGLSRFDDQDWQYFLGDVEVTALAVSPDGSLWAGAGCDVRRFDGIVWETVARCREDLPAGHVHDIAFTPDGATWIANAFSLARFDGQSWTVYEKLINSLVAAPDGAIWGNGWEGRQDSFYVARFTYPAGSTGDGEAWTTYKSADSFPGGFRVGAVTPDGRVWGIVPERGLASFDGGPWTDGQSWTFYPTADGLALDSIYHLTVAPDGALWVRADNGVARLDTSAGLANGEVWTVYTRDDGLVSQVGPIAFGPNGGIWFGTTRFQPTQAEDTLSAP